MYRNHDNLCTGHYQEKIRPNQFRCANLPTLLIHQQNEKRLEKWQNQDAKLLVEVQSDKEKQLEAKIATLEAALKRALKK